MGGSSTPSTPAPPDFAKTYQEGINVFLKNLPQMLDTEINTRWQQDPERIREQQELQSLYGPTQVQQQKDALEQFDPYSAWIRRDLANHVGEGLFAGDSANPVYGELQSRVLGDLQSGYKLPDDYARELEQSTRGAQAARGNIYGTGPALAESSVKGKAALDLYQQHIQNAAGFMGIKSPGQLATENAGNFLSGPTPEQQALAIQAVQPDRSMSYVNPSAGTQGASYGLQNYQNLLAQQQLVGNQRNPWASAATGAASGALTGAALGPWGALAGGVIGGAAGYFSDSRLKENIRLICKTAAGFPMVVFNYKGCKETMVGTLAEEVQKTRPDAVGERDGFLTVCYEKLDLPFYELKGFGNVAAT